VGPLVLVAGAGDEDPEELGDDVKHLRRVRALPRAAAAAREPPPPRFPGPCGACLIARRGLAGRAALMSRPLPMHAVSEALAWSSSTSSSSCARPSRMAACAPGARSAPRSRAVPAWDTRSGAAVAHAPGTPGR